MNEALKKAVELNEALEKKMVEVDAEIAQTALLSSKLEEQKRALAEKEVDLNIREAAIKKVEDVVTLANDAQSKLDEAKGIMAEANTRSKATAEYEKTVRVALDQRGLALSHREDSLKAKEDEHEKRVAKYEEELTAKIKEILKK